MVTTDIVFGKGKHVGENCNVIHGCKKEVAMLWEWVWYHSVLKNGKVDKVVRGLDESNGGVGVDSASWSNMCGEVVPELVEDDPSGAYVGDAVEVLDLGGKAGQDDAGVEGDR